MESTIWHHEAEWLVGRYGDEVAEIGCPLWLTRRKERSWRRAGRAAGSVGWTAPPTVEALAVVATGRAHPVDPRSEMPAALRPAMTGGLRLACVAARDGAIGWMAVAPGGERLAEPPEEGMILDIIRRSLGLPTPEPQHGVGRLMAAAWVSAIAAVAGCAGPLDWQEALRLHPAVLCEDVPPGAEMSTILDGARAASWEGMRRSAVARGGLGTEMSAEVAAWMDAGMFSRWVVAGLPDTDALTEMARPHLEPGVTCRLAHVLHRTT